MGPWRGHRGRWSVDDNSHSCTIQAVQAPISEGDFAVGGLQLTREARFYTFLVRTLRRAPDGALTNILPAEGQRPGTNSLHLLLSLPSMQVLRKAHDTLLAAGATEREHQQGEDDDSGGTSTALPRGQNGCGEQQTFRIVPFNAKACLQTV